MWNFQATCKEKGCRSWLNSKACITPFTSGRSLTANHCTRDRLLPARAITLSELVLAFHALTTLDHTIPSFFNAIKPQCASHVLQEAHSVFLIVWTHWFEKLYHFCSQFEQLSFILSGLDTGTKIYFCFPVYRKWLEGKIIWRREQLNWKVFNKARECIKILQRLSKTHASQTKTSPNQLVSEEAEPLANPFESSEKRRLEYWSLLLSGKVPASKRTVLLFLNPKFTFQHY